MDTYAKAKEKKMGMKSQWLTVGLVILLVMITLPVFSGGRQERTEEVVLRYWAAPLGTEEQVNRVWGEITADFYNETGIRVEFEMVPWPDIQTRLLTAMTAGGGPDVSGMGNNMSIGFSAAGGMLPLTPARLEKIGGWDRFIDADFIVGEDNKDPVSIPLTIVNGLLYYNTEMFEEVGVTELPARWDEFIEIAKAITADTTGDGNINRWGYGVYGQPTQSWKLYLPLMFQRGFELVSPDGRLQFNSEGGVDALEFLTELISVHRVSPPVAAEWNQNDMVNAFANGEIAMMIADSDFMARLDQTAIAGSYRVGPLPYIWPGRTDVFPDGFPATGHVGGTNIGILNTTRYEEESLQFLEFVSRQEVSAKINDSFTSLPPVRGAFRPEDLDQNRADALNVAENHLTPMPRVPYFQPSLGIATQAIRDAFVLASQGPVPRQEIQALLDRAVNEAHGSFLD